jgi:pyruvate,water dikinase
LLAGSSPASSGQHPELTAVRDALAGRAVSSLEQARLLSSSVATALDSYLTMHGTRLVDGYDVDTATLAERHDLLLHLLNTPAPLDREKDVAAATASVRSRVPAEEREQFDELLADARRAYGVRDDNNGILVGWAVGLLRRAMLAAGRRLGLEDASLAVEAGIDELLGALEGGLLDVDELHRRREYRRSVRASDAPRTLGPPEASPPAMPGALGTVMRIFGLYEFAITADRPLRGMGIGTHTYTGRARVLRGGVESVDLDGFEPGDVLVAPMTAPSCNVLLSLAGALVTEEGGIMSHAAMTARELGLPTVLGAARATELINDGSTVTVDPAAGSVTIE